jgi:hypothetical protein
MAFDCNHATGRTSKSPNRSRDDRHVKGQIATYQLTTEGHLRRCDAAGPTLRQRCGGPAPLKRGDTARNRAVYARASGIPQAQHGSIPVADVCSNARIRHGWIGQPTSIPSIRAQALPGQRPSRRPGDRAVQGPKRRAWGGAGLAVG